MTTVDLLNPNPFEDAIYATSGDLVARDVFAAVGYALTQWELSEILISTMFGILVKPSGNMHIAFRASGGLFASAQRRELIEAAAEAYFRFLLIDTDEDTTKRGVDLEKMIRRHMRLIGDASRRRDEIAHGVVMGEPLTNPPTPTHYFLIPSRYASKKQESLPPFKPSYRLGAAELYRYAELFGALGLRTGDINREVSLFYDSLPEKSRKRHP